MSGRTRLGRDRDGTGFVLLSVATVQPRFRALTVTCSLCLVALPHDAAAKARKPRRHEATPVGNVIPADPSPADSDRDGVLDATEVARGTDPLVHGIFPGSYPHIPEPMAFDLVRGLGATKGEFEGNVLIMSGLRRDVDWAPEIEWAFANRFALEFEIPMANTRVKALKMAVQGTMRESRKIFIHGWQTIGEYLIDDRMFEFTALYLAGVRIRKRPSLFLMVGPRSGFARSGLHAQLVVNPSLFIDVAETVTLGLENNVTLDGRQTSLRSLMQVHAQLNRHLRFQIGGGLEVASNQAIRPVIGVRWIIE